MAMETVSGKKKEAVLCRGITKSFDAGDDVVVALRGIDLSIESGELMMLVGPSGCGKTTLISVIAGILPWDQGTCRVLDVDYRACSPRELARFRGENVGFIFQSFNLLPVLTLEMNVAIPLIVNGKSEAHARQAARDILEEVGLGSRLDACPAELSGGQQQRVAIARALVHSPKLLVCDEPTSALDHATGAHIMGLLRETTRARGTTAIVVTHDSRIFDYANRIAYMDDGAITDVLSDPATFKTFERERTRGNEA